MVSESGICCLSQGVYRSLCDSCGETSSFISSSPLWTERRANILPTGKDPDGSLHAGVDPMPICLFSYIKKPASCSCSAADF